MNFFQTDLGILIYKLVATAAMIGAGVMLFKSAAASFKRTGKWTSVIDEIVVGFIGLVAYAIVISNQPMVIVNFLRGPIVWLFNLFKGFVSQVTGIPF